MAISAAPCSTASGQVPAAMGVRTNGRLLNIVGWATAGVMGLAAVGLIVTTILG